MQVVNCARARITLFGLVCRNVMMRKTVHLFIRISMLLEKTLPQPKVVSSAFAISSTCFKQTRETEHILCREMDALRVGAMQIMDTNS